MVQDIQGVTRKILLVDDEPSLQKMLTHALEREGFQIQVAGDGEAALEAFKSYEPHLIVLDIMLPKLDGTEVIRRIRAQSEVPVIMLTAKDDEIDRVVGLELGADDYVTKPFAVRELVARVRAIMRRAAVPAGQRPDELVYDRLRINLPSGREPEVGGGAAMAHTERERPGTVAGGGGPPRGGARRRQAAHHPAAPPGRSGRRRGGPDIHGVRAPGSPGVESRP